MRKFLTFATITIMMIVTAGCEVRTRTVVLPKHGGTVVHKSPTTTTVVYEDPAYFYCDEGVGIPYEWQCDGVDDCWGGEDEHYCGGTVIVEEYYTSEPYYADYCEAYGSEECCHDYDWNVVWISPHEYVYEVCEYTSCVDYYWNDAWDAGVDCWYE